MAVQHTRPYLADYIWEAPDDGQRYEVIDGLLYVSATPSLEHQEAVAALLTILRVHVRAEQLGRVIVAPFGVILDKFTGVEPDILFVSHERAHLLKSRGLEGPPDLAVEVLSPSTRRTDREVKFERYARAGIPHYWIIDPLALTLEAYILADGVYVLAANLRDEDHFSPILFPGLTIPLADLWL